MAKERKKYDPEFKRQAVRLMQESGKSVSELAEDLGVTSKMLYRWRQALERDGGQAFPGNGRLKPDDEYVRRLERELEIVRQERDILKKVVGIFSREPKR
jgi:transposase